MDYRNEYKTIELLEKNIRENLCESHVRQIPLSYNTKSPIHKRKMHTLTKHLKIKTRTKVEFKNFMKIVG